MRHRKGFNHLGRTSEHRKAMLANMASSLILHKRITTTTAKAKALRMYIEPLITKSKDDSTHSRRVVFSYLKDKHAVSELFREVSPKIMDRPGGYTRILKIGNRLGDNADMCIIELVDYNTSLLEAKEAAKTKSTRRRRGGKKKTTTETAPQEEASADEVKSEEQPVKNEPEAVETAAGETSEEKTVEVTTAPVETEAKDTAKTGKSGEEKPEAKTKTEEETPVEDAQAKVETPDETPVEEKKTDEEKAVSKSEEDKKEEDTKS